MSRDNKRIAERESHSAASKLSRDIAIKSWRAATTPEKKKEYATAVAANVPEYGGLVVAIGATEAGAIWKDAGKTVPAAA